jgi:PilZ domain
MVKDKRKLPRRAVSLRVKIDIADGALVRDCLVTDISNVGVRLYVEGLEVPDAFVLLLGEPDGSIRPRACQVIWRLGYELGVKFADAPRRDEQAKGSKRSKQPAIA